MVLHLALKPVAVSILGKQLGQHCLGIPIIVKQKINNLMTGQAGDLHGHDDDILREHKLIRVTHAII